MDGLILFAHGSVLCGAGETLRAHAERFRARGEFRVVETAFLNYSPPFFAEAVARCAAAGATRIIVVPYFLIPGKFVRTDLPAEIEKARQAHPSLTFVVAEPIGYDASLADALIESARAAREPATWRTEWERAAEFCEPDPQCPLYATPRCPKVPAPLAEETLTP